MWIAAACGSAFFGGITAILAKQGVRKCDSDIATAVRTVIVLLFAWAVTFAAGSSNGLGVLGGKTLLFLLLSGLATCASWLCYFKALSLGEVNKVVVVDKSGIILAVLAGILFFRETTHLPMKLFCTSLIGAGIFLMIEKEKSGIVKEERRGWLLYAFLSAVFAAATSLLAKIGLEGVDSNLGTAVRTIVIFAAAWGIVGAKGKLPLLKTVPRNEILFLLLSGVSTGISWLCYFFAIQKGSVSVVIPIDRLSVLVTVLFSRIVFQERLTRKGVFGLALLIVGTVGMTLTG